MGKLQKTAEGVFKKSDVAAAIAALNAQECREKLFEACADNDTATLEALIIRDPTLLHMRDDSGWTPLHAATGWCAVETVEILLRMGANPESADSKGQSPRELAHQLGFGTLAGMMTDIPKDNQARAKIIEKEALKREICTITAGLPKPCVVHKHPLRLKH